MNRAGDIRVDEIMPRLKSLWPKMPFEDCLIEKGAKYKKLKKKEMKPTGKIPVIDQGKNYISGYTNKESNSYTGDLPVIIFGDHTRRVKFIDFKFAVGADGTKLLHPFEALHPKFFYYYINCLRIKSQGYSRHYRFLKQIEVPIPSFNEQKRIVVKLKKLLTKVDQCKERLEKIPTILKRFRQSVLAAACSGRLTADWRDKNPKLEPVSEIYDKIQKKRDNWYADKCKTAIKKGVRKPNDPKKNKKSNRPIDKLPNIPGRWQYFRLEDLCFLVTDGTHHTPKYKRIGIPFLSVKNVRPFRILRDNIKHISPDEHKKLTIRCNPEAGDILYTKVGATFGYAAKNNLNFDFSIFVSLCLIKPVSPYFLSDYAEIVINSENIFSQARERVSGIGTPDLHLIEIRDFRVPLPPVKEQKEIVQRVEALFKIADKIDARYQKAKVHVEKLTQSILDRAFRGELVPQDPSDPPASELLKQIKAEKEKQQAELKAQKNPKRKTKPKRKKKT